MKKNYIIVGIVILALVVWSVNSKPTVPSDSSVLSLKGLHWHPTIEIYVAGEKIEIPANIGLKGGHMPIHTHTEDVSQGVVHMEFEDTVEKSDTKLGNFFSNWDKDMRSFGSNMSMTVNGVENFEFEEYQMKEGDVIKLQYE